MKGTLWIDGQRDEKVTQQQIKHLIIFKSKKDDRERERDRK